MGPTRLPSAVPFLLISGGTGFVSWRPVEDSSLPDASGTLTTPFFQHFSLQTGSCPSTVSLSTFNFNSGAPSASMPAEGGSGGLWSKACLPISDRRFEIHRASGVTLPGSGCGSETFLLSPITVEQAISNRTSQALFSIGSLLSCRVDN